MSTKKKAAPKAAKPAKKAVKPAPKKQPVKKAEPVKAAAKKVAKPAPKVPAKKAAVAAPAKPVAKPAVAKPATAPSKVTAKPVASAHKEEKHPAKPAAPAPTAATAKKPAEVKPLPTKKIEVPAEPEATKPTPKPADVKKAAKPQEVKKPAKPVVMPKINATTSRKYEPEFTKSVLDQPATENTGPTMRYSDAELVEFRELIGRKLEAAKKELSYLHGLITRKDEMSGDETDNRYMTMEDGSLSMEREQLSQMASRQIDFIDKLEKALIRIENKTYGICRVTGKLIDKARLRAVPHATLSIEAKMGMSRNPNIQ
jgi:RNA polymerase-binding transcription factor DksA